MQIKFSDPKKHLQQTLPFWRSQVVW